MDYITLLFVRLPDGRNLLVFVLFLKLIIYLICVEGGRDVSWGGYCSSEQEGEGAEYLPWCNQRLPGWGGGGPADGDSRRWRRSSRCKGWRRWAGFLLPSPTRRHCSLTCLYSRVRKAQLLVPCYRGKNIYIIKVGTLQFCYLSTQSLLWQL